MSILQCWNPSVPMIWSWGASTISQETTVGRGATPTISQEATVWSPTISTETTVWFGGQPPQYLEDDGFIETSTVKNRVETFWVMFFLGFGHFSGTRRFR